MADCCTLFYIQERKDEAISLKIKYLKVLDSSPVRTALKPRRNFLRGFLRLDY